MQYQSIHSMLNNNQSCAGCCCCETLHLFVNAVEYYRIMCVAVAQHCGDAIAVDNGCRRLWDVG